MMLIEALKMPEDGEKQSFTLFAFLPPYIGVSGSLVFRKRKSVKRSIDWYQKILISWHVARYAAVSLCLVSTPCHATRTTHKKKRMFNMNIVNFRLQ